MANRNKPLKIDDVKHLYIHHWFLKFKTCYDGSLFESGKAKKVILTWKIFAILKKCYRDRISSAISILIVLVIKKNNKGSYEKVFYELCEQILVCYRYKIILCKDCKCIPCVIKNYLIKFLTH